MSSSPPRDRTICEACRDLFNVLKTVQPNQDAEPITVDRSQLLVLYQYLGIWVQRQCLCIFRESKNIDRFSLLIHGVTSLCVHQLKNLQTVLAPESAGDAAEWTTEEIERLFQFMAKVFMLQFPLYAGAKQVNHRFDDLSQGEATQLAVFCDGHDSTDFPIVLLRMVTLFCKSGGLQGMAQAFKLSPGLVGPNIARAMISILCNVKLWLNYRALLQLFLPVRTNALHYMCELTYQDLRSQSARQMADFLWSSVKENVDSPIQFDKDGLDLAFKYFCSTTLTMRLAGITQINSHINLFNELCNTESVVEVETVGLRLAGWLLQNRIVEHIFGPNLHIEVIKQSHIILNFLAVEGKITNEHINVIWQAAQLKHCAKQVSDTLLPLIKNLEAAPVLHLYELLKALPIKEHTEQTIQLAQVLQKVIWNSGGTLNQLLQEANALQKPEKKETNTYLSSSDEEPPKKKKGGKGSDCEFDLDEDDLNEYSDDEEEEEDDDEDLPSSDEEKKEKTKEPPALVPVEKPKAPSGKRTKGLPVKGIKRTRLVRSSESDPDESAKTAIPDSKKRRATSEGGEAWWTGEKWNPAEPNTAMAELANLVNAHNPAMRSPEIHTMRPFLRNMVSSSQLMDEGLSGDNESVSSRLTNKSDKNLADFEDENSADEEMLQFAPQTPQEITAMIQQQQQLANMATLYQQRFVAPRLTARQQREEARILAHYKIETACEPGNTLLWDLLQDGNIEQLAEGLAIEAEKALTSLICFNMERLIRLKFIEGCINNIGKNRSVAISLRLLPKLFQSFQHFRNIEIHEITIYTEKTYGMMRLFFNNLQTYTKEYKEGKEHPFFNHLVQIQVRLQFLSVVFSIQVSSAEFKLTQDQINILWECLASDPICADDLFQWLLVQAHSKEQHAIGIEGFKLIYNEKLPMLKPETITMLGLNLYSQLHQVSRVIRNENSEETSIKMDQLWKIALCAQNTDVSMKAIQILNSTYFSQGEDFLTTCMDSLNTAANDLHTGRDEILLRIQRALLLLKTYLETFRRKYAYHFRRLSVEGQGVSTHAELVDLKSAGPIRILVQAGGFQEKVTFDMQATDMIADLRAEISAWWEGKLQQRNSADKSMLGTMLNEGPLRLITQGQEISTDSDEKTLMEVGFKDQQLVFVSQGATRSISTGSGFRYLHDVPPFPGKDRMPMNLLLQPEYFEQLFSLMQRLADLRLKNEKGENTPHTKAQILSRRVWDILMLLPTNSQLKDKLQNVTQENSSELKQLLNPESPQKLMYTFYIVDWLSRPARLRRHSGVVEDKSSSPPSGSSSGQSGNPWVTKFVEAGGLLHLFNILVSGSLQKQGETVWCEWKQDCLSALLKLLLQFGVDSQDYEALADQILEASSTPRKRFRRYHGRKSSGSDRLLIPRLSTRMLQLMDVETVMPCLMSILMEAAFVRDLNHYRTSVFGRAQVIHFALGLLVSWIYSVDDIEDSLFSSNGLPAWLRHLLLDDHDPGVRRELCTGLYRMCMGQTCTTGRTGVSCTAPMLSILLEFLDDAMLMKPMRRAETHPSMDEGKEPYGPACRDYFWILCRLVDNLHANDGDVDAGGLIDLDQLSRQLACGLVSRRIFEKRHGDSSADDVLVGVLNLLCAVMKHQPSFKASPEGQEFILHLWECLFALPNPKEKSLPKCKSNLSRSSCYDLIVEMCKGCLPNYLILHGKLLKQHHQDSHKPYQWEYWPKEDGRSECGYVGLTNLGATCYMASCVQQLYMIPQARYGILESKPELESTSGPYLSTLQELQRMFAYLRESERKAYNPASFCKNYQMDHQPLNTGEQKDMAEFFIDLLSKMEEMTPKLKNIVKKLFCGTLTNNVVSLDCNHVSRTAEEFYTVRCQVAEMRNLHQSLEEVTVKDTLEGDNMYTCSQCEKKVRAEKRACFKKLPKILAFNTMRYTFNMVTMLKEKVNTHFSFPFRLDMSPYMEHNLIPNDKQDVDKAEEDSKEERDDESLEYELIGVTVHTGTADGGHYYAFIRDRSNDSWFSFNDAEVKPFDPSQIASECFGGEMSSRTYDQVTDKFMDLSIEKTNSAYMLFYERIESDNRAGPSSAEKENESSPVAERKTVDLSKELEEWIWEDNMNFIQDNNVYDHVYFNFMWQMVGYVPTTLGQRSSEDITLLSAKLATSFFLESFIHAKEKLNIVQWVEFLTKQFDSSTAACSWFLDHMAEDSHWSVTIFLKCQVATIRQMFHRLCIHVIQKLRPMEKASYSSPWKETDPGSHPDAETRAQIGRASPITRFIRMLLSLLDSGAARPYLKYLTELFRFLYDFAKLGEEETRFLLSVQAISTFVDFYLKAIKQSPESITVDVVSDEDEEEDDIIALAPISESNKMASLDKMVWLIALMVEKSRGEDNHIHLSEEDMNSLTGGKSLVFLYNITKDNINPCQTCNLVFSLTRNNQLLAEQVAAMVFHGVKQADHSMHFFRLLTLLTEFSGGPSGMPCFTSLVMHKVWDLAKTCPQAALDWLSIQVTRNRYVSSWLISTMENWVEPYLMAHNNQKVRNAASFLIVNLIPSFHFRQAFQKARAVPSPLRDTLLNREDTESLHQILEFLFSLLSNARNYIDLQQHGSAKLVAYFQTMTHFLLTRTEKRMFEPHFTNLWQLFHPKLSEPAIPVHHNKQALLNFWYQVSLDCPENVRLILQNPHATKNIAFNYILADHEESEVVNFNRMMLPTYYGLLRMCCMQSQSFTRQLAQHQNVQWAFENITPYTTQYTAACDELFKLMALFVQKFPDTPDEEESEIRSFRHQTLQLYLSILDGRSSWSTLINALKILIETNEDRIFVVYNNGLALIYDSFNMLHMMFHEATACHVTGELIEILSIFLDLVKAVRVQHNNGEIRQILSRWKDMSDMTARMLTLCNSFTPPELREVCLAAVKEMMLLWPPEMLNILVPILHRAHSTASETTETCGLGPYFPRKGHNLAGAANPKTVRPQRPMLQMQFPTAQVDVHHGQDPEFDRQLQAYFLQYHSLVDLMVRLAVNEDNLSKMLVDLSAMVGLDGVPLHYQLFPKLWLDIHNTQQIDRKFLTMLIQSHGFIEYVDSVLLDERGSLNNPHIFNFLMVFFPKVQKQVLTDQVRNIISQLVKSFIDIAATYALDRPSTVRHVNGDLRALLLVNATKVHNLTPGLMAALKTLRERVVSAKQKTEEETAEEDTSEEVKSPKEPQAQQATSPAKEGEPSTSESSEKQSTSTTSETKKSTDDQNSQMKEALAGLLKTLDNLIQLGEKESDNSTEATQTEKS